MASEGTRPIIMPSAALDIGAVHRPRRLVALWVPKTSSASGDQAIFVNQATDASLPSDAVVLKIDRFG